MAAGASAAPAAQSADARWVPVKVRYYDTPASAAPDRAVLEGAGIPTVLQDGEFISMEWQMHRAVGGTKIAVPADRLAEAVELLGGADAGSAGGAPDWLTPDELEATRLQTLSLVCILLLPLLPLLPWFWIRRAGFRRAHAAPTEEALRRLRRATVLALVETPVFLVMVFLVLAELGR